MDKQWQTQRQTQEQTQWQTHTYNKFAKVLYKETEDRYLTDAEVHPDDLQLLCEELYHHELLTVFGLQTDDDGLVDFPTLSSRISIVYNIVKDDPELVELIATNNQGIYDDTTTFLFLFSYELFHVVHKIICKY